VLPDNPRRSEKEMTYALYNYFFKRESGFDIYWARPYFLVDEQWSASYNSNGVWMVKACDIDGSYAGAWLVPEEAYFGNSYDRIEPSDDVAKAIASGTKRMAEMPPRPTFLRLSNSPREDMIMVAQQYIASMSRKQAEDEFITEIWQAVRNHYPLEWHIVYNDSLWWLIADYYEYRVRVYIDPFTGKISVSGGFAPF